jgi:hypothetical protein
MVLAAAFGVGSIPCPANAQELTTEEREHARQLFMRAVEYEQARNWSKALELFREVGQYRLTPQVRYHIALCEENLGKLVAALGGYQLALNEADKVDAPDFRTEIEGRIANLLVRIPKLVIERGPGAEAASIALDGVELGSKSIGSRVHVDPGPHTVSAKAQGYEDFLVTVSLDERQSETVSITMKKVVEDTGTGGAGGTGPVDTGVQQKPDRTVPYIVGGSGLFALLAGGGFFFLRMRAEGDANDLCGGDVTRCSGTDQDGKDAEDLLAKAETYNLVGIVAAGAGVTAVGVAAYLILTEPKKPASATTGVRLAPVAPGAHAGLSLLGRF